MKRLGATRPVTLAGIKFDALLSQDEVFKAQVPDYPVESGYKVHDSVLPDPLSIETTLYLSNTPVTWRRQIGTSRTRVKTVENRLRQLFWDREPVSYVTSDRAYRNMVIESMTISKTEEDGYARRIPITLKQVEVTATKTGVIPDSYVRGGQTEASAGTASVSTDSQGGSSGAAATGAVSTSSSQSKSTAEKENSQQKASILYKAGKGLGLIK